MKDGKALKIAAVQMEPRLLEKDRNLETCLGLARTAAGEGAGLIVFPGAYCDIEGYAPILREVARGGYLVVGVSMPFNFSIFAPFSADDVREAAEARASMEELAGEVETLRREREQVRTRVEKLLGQMEVLSST